MCTTLKEGKNYARGEKSLEGGKEEKRIMKSLCYERVCGGCVGERKASLRGQRIVEDVKTSTIY